MPARVPAPGQARRLMSRPRPWLAVAFVAGTVLLLVGLLLHGSVLSWFQSDAHWLGRALTGLERTAFPPSRWFHLLVFAWLTVSAWALYPRLRWWQVTGLLLGLAIAGELMQIPVPGRESNIVDIGDNLLGIAIGLVATAILRVCLRWHQQRKKIS